MSRSIKGFTIYQSDDKYNMVLCQNREEKKSICLLSLQKQRGKDHITFDIEKLLDETGWHLKKQADTSSRQSKRTHVFLAANWGSV